MKPLDATTKPKRFLDKTGLKYGRLTVIGLAGLINNKKVWLCQCECGNEISVKTQNLNTEKNGTRFRVNSCGCQKAENHKHLLTHTKEHKAWVSLKQRCFNHKDKDYAEYGGRGITVYPAWINDFEAFLAHIGNAPTKQHSIDRIDNNKGYEPGNVQWSTGSAQTRNRRESYTWVIKGIRFDSLMDAATHFAVTTTTIHKWTKNPAMEDCYAINKY